MTNLLNSGFWFDSSSTGERVLIFTNYRVPEIIYKMTARLSAMLFSESRYDS
jgi:hypothetical protein